MAADGVGNASKQRELGRLAARLRDVSEAALEVTSELDLEKTLKKVVEGARELVNARYAALGVAKPDFTGLSRFIVSGLTPEQIAAIGPWPKGLGLLGLLLREPKPIRVRNIAEDPRSIGFPAHHPIMRSFLGVPLRIGDRILGNFYLTDKIGAEEFSQEDEDIIVLFANHAAIAIENARRFTETSERLQKSLVEIRRSEERSRFLAELAGLLPIGLIVENIPWEKVVEKTTQLLGDASAIYLVDPENPEIVRNRIVFHRNDGRKEAARRLIEGAWEEIRRRVLGEREAIFVPGQEGQPQGSEVLDPELLRRWKFMAAMFVPIKTERRVYGLFCSLGSRPIVFDGDDLTFGMLVAERLGIAMENAELIRELRSALAARDEFISIATHELKTPIAVLLGYAQLLQLKDKAGAELDRRVLSAIEGQARRLNVLVNELLDVSRLRLGRLDLRLERFDLVDLVREVVERFIAIGAPEEARRLRLKIRDTGLIGRWDRSRVDQVLTNLISNALKYSPEGGEVLLEVRRKGDDALVSVRDRGIGIPADQQSRIFEPFSRATNARLRKIEGAGLGLHISKEIIDRHGGRMWFTSEEGKGSTFFFTVPLERGVERS